MRPPCLIPKQFHQCTIGDPIPSQQFLPTARSTQPPVTTHLCSIPVAQPLLDISHKQNPMTCGRLCLASFIRHHVFEVHTCCTVCPHLIPFYGCVIAHCMDKPGVLICSVRWALGLFPPLGRCDYMAMAKCVYVNQSDGNCCQPHSDFSAFK